ncbi:transposase [Paracoccus pantotrophus]|uniref:transposase n=1 Tax=Paracoccus pantotrophus TaxID=82367 RepID=UPI0035B248F5
MGRARGGLTAKIHAVVDARGRPIRLNLTEGQAHDGRSGDDMVGSIGAGRILLAGRGYDRHRLRDRFAERGARANIRPIPTRKRFPPAIRQARRQFPRIRTTRLHPHMVAEICVGTRVSGCSAEGGKRLHLRREARNGRARG